MGKLMCRCKETVLADSHTYRGVACTHRCQVLAPCCGQVYPCKKCHDQEEDHQLEVQSVQSMVCMACGLRQPSGGVSLQMASCSWSHHHGLAVVSGRRMWHWKGHAIHSLYQLHQTSLARGPPGLGRL